MKFAGKGWRKTGWVCPSCPKGKAFPFKRVFYAGVRSQGSRRRSNAIHYWRGRRRSRACSCSKATVMRTRLGASQAVKNATCWGESPRLSISDRVAARDVAPVGGFIRLLVLGEMRSNQKKTEQNAIGQFLDVHTLLHGVAFSIYPLTEDPVRW